MPPYLQGSPRRGRGERHRETMVVRTREAKFSEVLTHTCEGTRVTFQGAVLGQGTRLDLGAPVHNYLSRAIRCVTRVCARAWLSDSGPEGVSM